MAGMLTTDTLPVRATQTKNRKQEPNTPIKKQCNVPIIPVLPAAVYFGKQGCRVRAGSDGIGIISECQLSSRSLRQ